MDKGVITIDDGANFSFDEVAITLDDDAQLLPPRDALPAHMSYNRLISFSNSEVKLIVKGRGGEVIEGHIFQNKSGTMPLRGIILRENVRYAVVPDEIYEEWAQLTDGGKNKNAGPISLLPESGMEKERGLLLIASVSSFLSSRGKRHNPYCRHIYRHRKFLETFVGNFPKQNQRNYWHWQSKDKKN